MEELESQIAKIQLGNNKAPGSYVYLMAETAGSAELYAVAELPILTPAATEDCQRICLAIGSAFRRAYKTAPLSENTFETAIGQINEELGKLASLGQTQWIDKLNCVLGVRQGLELSMASTGKVAAFLFRNGEFTDISCSSDQTHPLKTFQNYAIGKIRLNDLIILSTTQLLNYLSLDRLKDIMSGDFLLGVKTIIGLLKQNSGGEASFGVLLNLQVPEGQAREQETATAGYSVPAGLTNKTVITRTLDYVKAFLPSSQPSAGLPKSINGGGAALGQRLKNLPQNTRSLMAGGNKIWQKAKTSAKAVKTSVNPQNFRSLSRQKKFFLASALILLLAVAANIIIAAHLKKSRAVQDQISGQLQNAKSLLANAQSLILYKDDSQAAGLIKQAGTDLPPAKNVPSADKILYSQISSQYQTLLQQIQKVTQVKVSDLGNLGKGLSLISLPQFLGTQAVGDIISYDLQSGQIADGALSCPVGIVASVDVNDSSAVVYDGTSLYVWNFLSGTLGPAFTQNVPAKSSFGGISFYGLNNRVYLIDKSAAEVLSFLVTKNTISKPVVSTQGPSLAQAQSLAVDGSIFALGQNGVNKFFAGGPAAFADSGLSTPLAPGDKIYTQKSFNNIYLMDVANNQILVMDKTGNLQETLKSSQFTKLMDFAVNEPGKTIFVLNDGNLLKVALP